MNFLSHLYLSGNSEGLIIGNFIADSVKGTEFNKFSDDIKKGIILHRKIDSFTDTHPIVEKSKERLRKNYKKYASVIVDIYYDHYLAINWKEHSEESLSDYTQRVYKIINQHLHVLPEKAALFNQYMVKYDILNAYIKTEGIERVLKGMSHRARFESNMEYAINDLHEHYELFHSEFKLFFPELKQYVNAQIEIL